MLTFIGAGLLLVLLVLYIIDWCSESTHPDAMSLKLNRPYTVRISSSRTTGERHLTLTAPPAGAGAAKGEKGRLELKANYVDRSFLGLPLPIWSSYTLKPVYPGTASFFIETWHRNRSVPPGASGQPAPSYRRVTVSIRGY